jgi:hypothetical protein
MMKTTTAIMVAAAIAAAVTILSAPAAPVDASSLPQAKTAPMMECAHRAWPYLRCVGTEFGNQKIRLVTTDRLPL